MDQEEKNEPFVDQPSDPSQTDIHASEEIESAPPQNVPDSGEETETKNNTTDTPLQSAKAPKKRNKRKIWQTLVLIFTLLLIIGGGSAGAVWYYYASNIQPEVAQFIRPVDRDPGETPVSGSQQESKDISGRPWNILILGSDNDNKYVFPNVLTQVMMIIRVDPIKKQVSMVSIPRDSWVPVPGLGYHKVSQAFYQGTLNGGSFEDGVRLARKTIEQDYGMHIDRYAWVGLDGFAKLIDVLGGVNVDVTHPMVDDAYPDDVGHNTDPSNPHAYKRLYIMPGPQHLNGFEALEYVRTRHGDSEGDFGRTVRQQQILQALKSKLDVATVLSNMQPILKSMEGSLYTDLDEGEMLGFANFGRLLDASMIQRLTLGPDGDYGQSTSIYDPSVGAEQFVVMPNCNTIQTALNKIFELGENTSSCKL